MRTLRDISLAIMFAAIAATAAATVDTEALAKQNGAEFHWFPIQKTFPPSLSKGSAPSM